MSAPMRMLRYVPDMSSCFRYSASSHQKFLSNGLKNYRFSFMCRNFVSKTISGPKRKIFVPLGLGVCFAAAVTAHRYGNNLGGYEIDGRISGGFPRVAAAEQSRRHQMNFIADVVETTAPAVVYIDVQKRDPYTGFMAQSNGSGFIIRDDGLILTNAHVVANKQTVRVKLHDGRSLQGEVQAVDPVSDLATVKIKAGNLPVLPLGESSTLRPGEWVIAMGSPLHLNNTVTAGIVSTTERGSKELGLHSKDIDYIQTDAVINFGNSGGPLINLDGEAIGINTMKVTTGISFAIPSDYVKEFLKKAEKIESRSESKAWFGLGGSSKSAPTRRYLGITMLTLTPNILTQLKSRQPGFPDVDHGVMVHGLVIGGPAAECGLHAGDIILKINNKKVTAASDVYNAVESTGDLKVTVCRDSETLTLIVTPEEVD